MDQKELRPILRRKFPRERASLLPALHFVQHELGYLPDWALQIVGWHLRVPASEVYGAATSYSELRIHRRGDHLVSVCGGLSCWSNGGRELLAYLSEKLSVSPGQTTSNGNVTLEETPCGFLCAVAPAVEIDSKWIGRAGLEDIIARIEGLA